MRRRTPVTTQALQLTNSKKYTPPHGEHIMTVSMQMNPMRDSTYRGRGRQGTVWLLVGLQRNMDTAILKEKTLTIPVLR